MKTFSYVLWHPFEHACGVVNANDIETAKAILKSTFYDYDNYKVTIQEIDTKTENMVTEIHYGG